jgi:hypothetical protein
LKLNGKHQPVIYAGNIHIIGVNIKIIHRNTEAELEAIREVGIEVDTEKST